MFSRFIILIIRIVVVIGRMSMTTVTAGVNKAFGTGSSSQQQLGTTRSGGSSGCRPLVSTQVAGGVNLALGTWHWGPYPLTDHVDLVNVQGEGFADDNEVAHLERDLGVIVEVVL